MSTRRPEAAIGAGFIERAASGFDRPQKEWKDLWHLLPHIRKIAFDIIDAVEAEGLPINEAATPERLTDEDAEELKAVARTTIDLGLRLANALKEYVIRRPERDEGLQVLRLGLAAARAAGDTDQEVEFLKRIGGALTRRDPDRARRYLVSGLALARETGARE
jgi:hypothetical protein